MCAPALQHTGPEHGDAQHGGPEHGDAKRRTKVSHLAWAVLHWHRACHFALCDAPLEKTGAAVDPASSNDHDAHLYADQLLSPQLKLPQL